MKCMDLRTRLPLLFSDELEAREVAELLRHIRLCAACDALVSDEARMQERFRQALQADEPRASFIADLRAELLPRRAVWRVAAAAAVILVLASLTLMLTQESAGTGTAPPPDSPAVGTTLWTPEGTTLSERTPILDVAQLQSLAISERSLDGEALAAFYAGLTDIERPKGWYRLLTPAAQSSNPMIEARVPGERARVFRLTPGAALELGLDLPLMAVLGGVRVQGDDAAEVIAIRDDDTCHVLVTSGRLRSLAFMLFKAERASSR